MIFNPDPTKQAQKVIFSRKATEKIHPKSYFNNTPPSKSASQKHQGLHLDLKLSFDIHIKTVLIKFSTSYLNVKIQVKQNQLVTTNPFIYCNFPSAAELIFRQSVFL